MTAHIKRLVISAPFGNYLHFPDTTPTLGTFTARRRGGLAWRLWQAARTVRYYPGIGAWKNRLGLPNPGIAALANRQYPEAIISVAGHCLEEWQMVVEGAAACSPAAIELNVSCPNCPGEDRSNYAAILPRIVRWAGSVPVIVKLPPIDYWRLIRTAVAFGIRSFHCCNTLPVPSGGLSGKPLQPLSLQAVQDVLDYGRFAGAALDTIIGGGGVTSEEDAKRYRDAGATHIAVGSVLFCPWAWPRIRRLAARLAQKETHHDRR